MGETFEIFGTLIRYDAIKDFRIIQKEYIYRPTYRECPKSILGALGIKKFEFAGMQPYAAIIDEKNKKSGLSSFNAKTMKESLGKELFDDVRTTIGDKFNIKAIRAKKYTCVNQTGRIFSTYLDDIPALVGRLDGKFSDVMKNDDLYPLLGEPIAPAINIVPVLVIKANEEFVFYGNGIQLDNIEEQFQRLKYEMELYKEELKNSCIQKKIFSKMPSLNLPGKKQNLLKSGSVETDLAKLKKALADNILTQEEYDTKVAAIIEKL